MNQNLKFIMACLTSLLSSCCSNYIVKNSEIVLVSAVVPEGFELVLSGQRCIGGHDPWSALIKSEVDVLHYIYLPQRIGKFDAGRIILSYEKGKYEFPNAIQELKGNLNVTENVLDINLEIPEFDEFGVVKDYQPYEFNGTYMIVRNKNHDTWL